MGTYRICQYCLGAIVRNEVKVKKGKKELGSYHKGCAVKKYKIK